MVMLTWFNGDVMMCCYWCLWRFKRLVRDVGDDGDVRLIEEMKLKYGERWRKFVGDGYYLY